MKTLRTLILSVVALAATGTLCMAQKAFKPLETWPYLYENFTKGGIVNTKGNAVAYDALNINVVDGKLHYVQDGKIMAADMMQVKYATVGDDLYVNQQGKMWKVLKETEHGGVLQFTSVDIDEMQKADIGYGKSSVASTQNASLIALENAESSSYVPINKSLESLDSDKYSGSVLPLLVAKYIMVDGTVTKATKPDILSFPGVDKSAIKSYIKEKKVKFADVESLAALAEFLHEKK